MGKQYGTTHFPHGWLGLNAEWGGCCPTIDAGIWKQHTLLIERDTMETVKVKQANKKGFEECEIGGVADLNYVSSTTRRGRVQGGGQVSPALTTENLPNVLEDWVWEVDGVKYRIRIRKLTPKECWRLMGFTDEDFEKAEEVNSNTQLYKQAGNSIVKDVLEGIFSNLL